MTTRQVRDCWGNQHEITDDEGQMLWSAHNARGTYQPPGELLDVARRLVERGWLEQYRDFASLTTSDDGYWIGVAWYGEVEGAAERSRDYLAMRKSGR